MNVSNHVLVGSGIALAIHHPIAALPLAAASHFILDILPHFGYHRGGYQEVFKHRLTYIAVLLDIIGVMILLFTIVTMNWLVFTAGVIAALPDTVWLNRYFRYERKEKPLDETWLTRMHDRIQWGERPWGLLIEIVFFVSVFVLISSKIHA
jgi:hypothetical protein